MKRLAPTIAVVLSAVSVFGGCAGPVPTEQEIAADNRQASFDQIMRFAETNRRGGDLGNAIVFYERAHGIDPASSAPLVGIAEASLRLGSAQDAAAA